MNLKYFLYSIFDESLFVMRKANLISQFLTDYVKVNIQNIFMDSYLFVNSWLLLKKSC